MNLPPSSFADTFRATVVPRLRPVIEARGLFVALEMETFTEARGDLIREAGRLGAYHLPPEHLDALSDWIARELVLAIDRKTIPTNDTVWRQVKAWDATVQAHFEAVTANG